MERACSNSPLEHSSTTTTTTSSRIHRKRRPRPVSTTAGGNNVFASVDSSSSSGHDSYFATDTNRGFGEEGDGRNASSNSEPQSRTLLCSVCGDRALGCVASLQCLCLHNIGTKFLCDSCKHRRSVKGPGGQSQPLSQKNLGHDRLFL